MGELRRPLIQRATIRKFSAGKSVEEERSLWLFYDPFRDTEEHFGTKERIESMVTDRQLNCNWKTGNLSVETDWTGCGDTNIDRDTQVPRAETLEEENPANFLSFKVAVLCVCQSFDRSVGVVEKWILIWIRIYLLSSLGRSVRPWSKWLLLSVGRVHSGCEAADK